MKITLAKKDDACRTVIEIPAAIYETIREFIMATLSTKGEITFYDLLDEAVRDKAIAPEGDLPWYLLQVKRDLEAKKIIKVTVGVKPFFIQTIKLEKKKRSHSGDHIE